MKAKKFMMTLLAAGMATLAAAQTTLDTARVKPTIWDKKLHWGVTFNNSWATIKGTNLPNNYFWKPSVGTSIRAEYFFHKNIGVSIGFQYQQKGSGIITPDFNKTLGDPDSTYRARIKLHALEVPISIHLRSGEVIKNTRFQASLGIAPMRNFKSKFVQYSVEDGFHVMELRNGEYYKGDLAFTAAGGIDINAGNACIFQIHFYGTWGTKNVYNPNVYSDASGKTKIIGMRLGWMF
jgi:Outer membrane protein beta-barrel domain